MAKQGSELALALSVPRELDRDDGLGRERWRDTLKRHTASEDALPWRGVVDLDSDGELGAYSQSLEAIKGVGGLVVACAWGGRRYPLDTGVIEQLNMAAEYNVAIFSDVELESVLPQDKDGGRLTFDPDWAVLLEYPVFREVAVRSQISEVLKGRGL